MSPLLQVLENEVQLAALSFLGLVYLLKLIWLFRFRSRRERTFPAGRPSVGVAVSMFNVLMPWQMESTRRQPGFYLQFAIFHLGVAAAILVSFIIPYAPELLARDWVTAGLQTVMAAATLIGLLRLARRIRRPSLRLISTPDDYLSLGITVLFQAAAVLALSGFAARHEGPRILFFGLTAVFLVYVPFSKICHYLYYPFTRYFLGRNLGHRGVVAKLQRSRHA